MAQIINTNISSINAQRNLNKSQGALQTSLERLSSGLRINSAKDDAAGLAISNRFTTQVRGLNVAIRNANDGISLAQTTESALDEITTSLQRIRDLAVQSANDSNSMEDRISLQAEVDQLKDEINRISRTTAFNGRHVLDGSMSAYYFQIGANAGEGVSVTGVDARISSLGSQPGAVQSTFEASSNAAEVQSNLTIRIGDNGASVNIMDAPYGGNITGADAANLANSASPDFGSGLAKSLAERINKLRADGVEGLEGVYASAKTTFDYSDANVAAADAEDAYIGAGSLGNGDFVINGVNVGPVEVQERDANGALRNAINAKSDLTGVTASIDGVGRLILTADDGRDVVITTASDAEEVLFNGGEAAAGVAQLTQANGFKTGELTISAQDTLNLTASGDGITTLDADRENVQAVGTIANADITTVEGSNITMKSVDSAMAQIDAFRGEMGAIQNRFESTIRNLSAVAESLSAANSRIRDADFAAETAALSKNQVLQQAGISVLAQANALPQQVLSLLQG